MTHRACTPVNRSQAAQNTAQEELGRNIREATHPGWKIQDGSMRQERKEKVWSVRGSIKGRRRRRQEEKATAGAGTGLRQRGRMEEGGEGEGQRQDAEGETQGTEQRGGERKEGEAVGKGFS